jgi:uncharacterized membrane protein YkoI
MSDVIRDIEAFLHESGDYDDEVIDMAKQLLYKTETVEEPSEQFRKNLKTRLMNQAHTKFRYSHHRPHTLTLRWFAGLAAAVMIFVGGLSYYLTQGAWFRNPVTSVQMGTLYTTSQDNTEPPNSRLEDLSDDNMDRQTSKLEDTLSIETDILQQDKAIQIAKDFVNYPAKVLDVHLEEKEGQYYWYVSLHRDGIGIPNRDDFLINCKTGEVIHTLTAQ